jgi:hypothetical protein
MAPARRPAAAATCRPRTRLRLSAGPRWRGEAAFRHRAEATARGAEHTARGAEHDAFSTPVGAPQGRWCIASIEWSKSRFQERTERVNEHHKIAWSAATCAVRQCHVAISSQKLSPVLAPCFAPGPSGAAGSNGRGALPQRSAALLALAALAVPQAPRQRASRRLRASRARSRRACAPELACCCTSAPHWRNPRIALTRACLTRVAQPKTKWSSQEEAALVSGVKKCVRIRAALRAATIPALLGPALRAAACCER